MALSLNEQQEAVANHLDGPCLCVAVPGSGKTATLTERVVRLLDKGIPSRNLLCVTFTNKAANEMKTRILDRVGKEGLEGAYVGTFHSFCASVLRAFARRVGHTKRFTIMDSNDQKELFTRCARKLGFDPGTLKARQIYIGTLIKVVNKCREDCDTYEQIAAKFDEKFSDDGCWKIAKSYLEEMKKKDLIDFTGLIYETVGLFDNHPDVLAKFHERFIYIQVDEVQDTNYSQFRLINLLGGEKCNVVMVGDVSQSIYAFRGARYKNLVDFETQHPGCVRMELPLNYRSTPQIVGRADKLIRHNTSHIAEQFITENPDGKPVSVHKTRTAADEARWIASRCRFFIEEDGWDGGDISVFYRINAMSMALETAFTEEGIPYVVIGGRSFYDRKEIRDCIALLKFFHNPCDAIAFSRCGAFFKGIGAVTLGRIEEAAEGLGGDLLKACEDIRLISKKKTVIDAADRIRGIFSAETDSMDAAAAIQFLVEKSEYEDRMKVWCKEPDEYIDRKANIDELIVGAAAYKNKSGKGIAGYLQNIALITSSDKDSDKDSVSFMTIHAAKGLEFPIVFMVGVEKDMLPHAMAIYDARGDKQKEKEAIEEERRICYVGMTRAKKILHLSHCETRLIRTKKGLIPRASSPSRFLTEAGLLE